MISNTRTGYNSGGADNSALTPYPLDIGPLHAENFIGELSGKTRTCAGPPGNGRGQAQGRHARRGLQTIHPTRMGQHQSQRRFVLLQSRLEIADVVVALANHREVADRVDPASLGAANAALGRVLKSLDGLAVAARIEQLQSQKVGLAWHRRAFLHLRRAGTGQRTDRGPEPDCGDPVHPTPSPTRKAPSHHRHTPQFAHFSAQRLVPSADRTLFGHGTKPQPLASIVSPRIQIQVGNGSNVRHPTA